MTIENNTNPTDTDLVRIKESKDLSEMGQLWASTHAAFLLLTGNPLEVCLKAKEKLIERYDRSHRKGKILMITQTNNLCAAMADSLNPGFRESDLALQTRRLELISKIVKAEISEGEEAGQVVNLLMGITQIEIKSMSLTSGLPNEKQRIEKLEPVFINHIQ
jgi:hypothetical protein